jgi:hypothetical protein
MPGLNTCSDIKCLRIAPLESSSLGTCAGVAVIQGVVTQRSTDFGSPELRVITSNNGERFAGQSVHASNSQPVQQQARLAVLSLLQ